MIYTTRSNGKEHGSVMTNHEVVEFMLDVSGYTGNKNLSQITILEPSVGFGAFLLPMLERLFLSAQKFDFSFEGSLKNILAVDIDKEKVDILRKDVTDLLSKKEIKNSQEYAQNIVQEKDFLLSDFSLFDIVIGNPPYVRHELIPEDKKQEYRKLFNSFRHRSDLYIAFFEKALSLLKENGKVNFICADRWMKNKYGEKLRELIKKSFHVSLIVDIDSDEVFDEKVSAYPAITLIENRDQSGFIREKLEHIEHLSVIKQSFLKEEFKECSFSFVDRITNTNFSSIEEQGFKIGIGVATGADAIFIKKSVEFENIEKKSLLPLVKSENIIDGEIKNVDQEVLNPSYLFTENLIYSNNFPKAEKYLESHKEKLSNRHIAKKNPENWYKTIDRIYPELTKKPKLLIPDIKKNGDSIVLDSGKYYPHHNIYYITHYLDKTSSLEILGAFLLSDFVHEQMKNISVLMRGGHFRWQAQNLRKLKIPKIQNISRQQKELLSSAYRSRNFETINNIVNKLVLITKNETQIRSSKKFNSPPTPLEFFGTENQTFLKNDKKRKSLLRKKNKEKIDLLPTVAPRCTLAP